MVNAKLVVKPLCQYVVSPIKVSKVKQHVEPRAWNNTHSDQAEGHVYETTENSFTIIPNRNIVPAFL